MYGTKVGLAQEGRNRVPFLLLPNVNHVPTFLPSEFVEFAWFAYACISYDASRLLYVLSVEYNFKLTKCFGLLIKLC